MRRPSPPAFLLLPLLAVLVFGNCGGGVNSFLYNLQRNKRLGQLDSLLRQRRELRRLARHQLRGAARRNELVKIEQRTDEQAQALLPNDWQRRKYRHRRRKIEHRLRHRPVPKRPLLSPG